jgi:hypothetical protein
MISVIYILSEVVLNMKKLGVIIFISLMLVVPAAYAFSFSEFFGEVTGFLGITGHASKCTNPKTCGKTPCCSGYTCNKGTCIASAVCGDNIINGDETCDDGRSNGQVCSPAYSQSCTYCLEDCSQSITITGSYCGDETCDPEENCKICNDCGPCLTFDNEPSIDLTMGDSFNAGDISFSLNISESTKCKYSIESLEEVNLMTRRGGTSIIRENILEKSFDCEDSSELQTDLNKLSGTSFILTITARNNMGDDVANNRFNIQGSAIIVSPERNNIYTSLEPFAITISPYSSGTICEWGLTSSDDKVLFNCGKGYSANSNEVLNMGLINGVNILEVIVDGVSSSSTFEYYFTAEKINKKISSRTGFSRGASTESFKMLVGSSEEESIVDDDLILAYYSANENMRISGGMDVNSRDAIFDQIKTEAIMEKMTALKLAYGISDEENIKMALLPASRVNEIEEGVTHTQQFEVYTSHLSKDNIVSITKNPETHTITVNVLSSGIARSVKIKLESDPIEFILREGECTEVDMNNDNYPDVLTCYENGDVSVNDIVFSSSELEPLYDEDTTIVSSVSVTNIEEYNLPFNEKEIVSNIMQKYTPVFSVFGALLLILTVSSVRLAFLSTEKKSKKRK